MTRCLPRLAAPLLAAGILAATTPAAWAQSIDCGSEYTVKRGDTLARISRAAYGTLDYYRVLFQFNRAVIGADPSGIEIGLVLQIPCLDSSGRVIETAAEPAPEAEPTNLAEAVAQQAPVPEPAAQASAPPFRADPDREMRVAVAAAWPPLTDQEQAQGGMLTEIISRAADRLDLPRGFDLYFLEDWAGLTDTMLAEGRYDMALAWPRPDCERAPQDSESAWMCSELVWSEPLYEQVIGVYTLTGAPPPLSETDLYGATICRPAGYPLHVLADQGLTEPDVMLAQPETARDCFQGLLNGAYQAVVMARGVADGTIDALDAEDVITRQPTLDRVATLHAVTLRDNALGVERLAALDEEIRLLKTSGAWFEIVHRHMAAFKLQ